MNKETEAIIGDLNEVSNIAERIAENLVEGLKKSKFVHIDNILFFKKVHDFNSELVRLLIKFDHDVSGIERKDTTCSKQTTTRGSHL